MTLEDLSICYIIFKQQRATELAQLCYETIKLSKDQHVITKDDL
jgi:hypothetical protein